MKRSFVECAEVRLDSGADPAGPGGAVTRRLCGSWDHAGPCRWPHRTSAKWDGQRGMIRVVFTAPPEEEAEVRRLIDAALADGECVGPDGNRSHWTAASPTAGSLDDEERALSAQWE